MTLSQLPWPRILRLLTLLTAAGFIAVFLIVAFVRLSYPYDLEWMEGSMVDHVQRLVDGYPLYVRPSVDFTPFGYPPIYFYAAAGLSRLMGEGGFIPLRLLSILATAATMFFLYALVRHETRRHDVGLLAAGLFAATYQEVGFWFDIGRVDSLFMLLVVAGVYLLRRYQTIAGWLAAGALLGLSFHTKQLGFIIFAPLAVYAWLWQRRRAWSFLAGFALVAGGLALYFMARQPGWYWYYVYLQPSKHPWIVYQLGYFFLQDVPKTLGIAAVIGMIWLFLVPTEDREQRWFYILLMVGLVSAGLLPRMKEGGWDNDLIPTYTGLAIFLGLGVFALERLFTTPVWRTKLMSALWLACLVQLVGLSYHPLSPVPPEADRQAGRALLEKIAAYPGDVLYFAHGYLPRLAGKPCHASSMAVTDIFSAGIDSIAAPLRAELKNDIHSQRFSAIILDFDDPKTWNPAGLDQYYVKRETLFENPMSFWPISGAAVRPEWIYVPRSDSSGMAAPAPAGAGL
jgi:4-amino-4-deoxy-L-arabinose transferase-like glycosyltransferase